MKIRTLAITLLASVAVCRGSQEVQNLWGSYDARKEPLNVEVVKEWEGDEGNFSLVRYSLGKLTGSNKSAAPIIAAYYGYPKGGEELPAILHLHGGGQRGSIGRVEYWVKLGYAAMSINWGGKVLEGETTPNTDWDGLAAGFIGSRDETHHNDVSPGPNTLYKEPHALNSSWNLIAMAARRALTFLEQQPEVDGGRLGVEGHSMGGRATVLTVIDSRVRAASPSVGGSGYLYRDFWGVPGSGRHMREDFDYYERVVSAQSYWKHITCPTLFLGASNDFNSPTEAVIDGMANLPASTDRRLALAPHLNHRFTTGAAAARTLWMESRLKENFDFPAQSRGELTLENADGIPRFKVWPAMSADAVVAKVDIYYSYGRNPHIRFWRDARAKRGGDHYVGACPVFDVGEPLFAFANITYTVNRKVPMSPGYDNPTDQLTVTSDYCMAYPDQLKEAGVKATEKQQRLIDDFSRGWHDWYRLSANNSHHWFFATRKVIDPSWMGPRGGKLAVDIITAEPGNELAVTAHVNDWQGYTGRKRDTFHAFVDLARKGVNAVELAAADFRNDKGEPLRDWDEFTEIGFQSAWKAKSSEVPGTAKWEGDIPTFQNMRWVGGTYVKRPYPYQPRDSRADAYLVR